MFVSSYAEALIPYHIYFSEPIAPYDLLCYYYYGVIIAAVLLFDVIWASYSGVCCYFFTELSCSCSSASSYFSRNEGPWCTRKQSTASLFDRECHTSNSKKN